MGDPMDELGVSQANWALLLPRSYQNIYNGKQVIFTFRKYIYIFLKDNFKTYAIEIELEPSSTSTARSHSAPCDTHVTSPCERGYPGGCSEKYSLQNNHTRRGRGGGRSSRSGCRGGTFPPAGITSI